jgi:pilus assembly protein CpaB
VAAEITPGLRAYTIKVTDVSGVGGHVLPGDRVDVVLMRNLATDGPQSGARNVVSDVVLQNVRVLGVDLNADPTSNKPAPPNTATLEVAVKDAQKLAVAASLGELSLALRRLGQVDVEATGPVRVGDFARAGTSRATPGPRGVPRARAVRPPLIQVVEGEGGEAPSGA